MNYIKMYFKKIGNCSPKDLREFCENERIKTKHLNQILGTNKVNIKKLNNSGIYNYIDLAKLDPKKTIKGLKDEKKTKLINQAKLQLESKKEGVPKFKYIKENFILKQRF